VRLRSFDTLIAHKAINLIPDLSGGDKRVAGAIIDHFNRRTEQCDPSNERLARLLGISRRTVIRSTSRLERRGLIRKRRHGGNLNRNSYEPVWPLFRELEAAWNVRFREKRANAKATEVSPSPCQHGHLTSDGPVTQTLLSNPLKETYPSEAAAAKLRPKSQSTDCKGWPKKEEERLRGTAPSPALDKSSAVKAARTAAERRWNAALHARFTPTPALYAEIIEAIDRELQEAATEAEIRSRGAGLAHIIEQLRHRGMRHSAQINGFDRQEQPK
jgi:DNA-binding transcriptional MocR family regulator